MEYMAFLKDAYDKLEELEKYSISARESLKLFELKLQVAKEVHALACKSVYKMPTSELVEELMKREGVETTIAEPYEDVVVAANGPAIILKVID